MIPLLEQKDLQAIAQLIENMKTNWILKLLPINQRLDTIDQRLDTVDERLDEDDVSTLKEDVTVLKGDVFTLRGGSYCPERRCLYSQGDDAYSPER